ncbi:hypothetical protein O9993_17705 [Vibrio lentus]|nr:hypothetical protein [Vibrio lentus]
MFASESEFEIARWVQEIKHLSESRQQLAIDEIGLMLKRICLDGWQQLLVNRQDKSTSKGCRNTLNFMSAKCWNTLPRITYQPLTVKDIAEQVIDYMPTMQ